ncbi:response regulator [Candidatus Omnitrophota bacterium]
MSKKKILVVDDELDFLTIVKLNLERTGKYEVLTLSDPKEILSKVGSFRPDVILLDLVMPGIGGIEVCDMLNQDPFGKTIPIIIFSALDRDEDKNRAYKKGVVGYLAKPMDQEGLIVKIEKALQPKQENN